VKKRVRPATALTEETPGVVPACEARKATGRKPSKKASVSAQFADAASCRSHAAAWLNAAREDIAAKHGGDLMVHNAGQEHALIRGVPLPALALEYLFQNTVLPLGGRVTQIVGLPGSCKSGLAIEFGRWFIDSGGVVVYREHESKYSPDWVPSIIGWDRQDSFMLHACHSINDWQNSLLTWDAKIQEMMDGKSAKEPGPGAVYPVLNVVDSVMGKSMEESQDRVVAAGHAGRDHPVEAGSITKFMRAYPQRVANWPFHTILINHLRLSKDPTTQAKVRDKPGGWQKDFQETFEVESSKIGAISTAEFDGLRLQLQTYKNSLGTGGRRIEVCVRWWEEDDPERPGEYRQKTVWDWDEATILLLAKHLQPEARRNRAKKLLDLSVNDRGLVTSKRLGVGVDEQPPASFAEASAKLHADAELLRELRRVLGIKVRAVFTPGVDFREQMLGSRGAAAEAYKSEKAYRAAKQKKKRPFG
jgi:hypothetical protein